MSALQIARLAQLEGALLGLLRGEGEDSSDTPDGLIVHVETDPLQGVVIDLTYTKHGVPVAGESL